MKFSSKKTQFTDDKYLISEQPAMMIVLTGIIAAFFIGFSLKALFNPVRITQKVAQAAGRVHRDVQISFDSAEVSLADGWIPELAVVIKNVKLSSEKACWGKPEVFIDELKLPISIVSYLRAKAPVRRIEAHELVLNFRGGPVKCEGVVQIEPKVRVETNSGLGSASTSVDSEIFQQMTENTKDVKRYPIDRINIDSFRINFIPMPRYRAQFEDVKLRTQGVNSSAFVLDAKTHLFKDEVLGDFLSSAHLHVEYSESPESKVLVHFFGNLREGYYSLIGNYSLSDHLLNFESEMKHIPLSSVVEVISKATGEPKRVHPKKMWLSFKSHLAGDIEKLKVAPLQIRDLQLEGDVLDLKTDLIEFTSLSPLTYKPIHLIVEDLSLNELLQVYETKLPSKTVGNLGSFTGTVDISDSNQMDFRGDIEDLELNFSNRGQREIQKIERMNTSIRFDGEKWFGQLGRVELENGVLSGDIEILANRDLKKINLKSNLEELILSEKVQKLMTGGGFVKPLKAAIQIQWDEGKVPAVRGILKSDGILVDGVQLDNLAVSMSMVKDQLVLESKVKNIMVLNQTPAHDLLSPVFLAQDSGKNEIKLVDVKAKFEVPNSQELRWKNVTGETNKLHHVQLSGGWNSFGSLYGDIEVRDNKKIKSYNLKGMRSSPQIIEKK